MIIVAAKLTLVFIMTAGACGQLVVEQGGAGCGGQVAGKAADIEELGKRAANLTTAVA